MDINEIQAWFGRHQEFSEIILLIVVILSALISYKIFNLYLLRLVKKLVQKSKTRIDDFIIESDALKRFSYLLPIIVVYFLAFLYPSIENIIVTICMVLAIWILLFSITAFFQALNKYYETKPISNERPIKGYIQVGNIIIYLLGSIIMIGLLTGKSPLSVLGGIGAFAAVIILIFKDTILSFVSSIQISTYDLVHKGDWIEMPRYGADGAVIDIALHTIKVQNWDKTITVIPTHKLIDESFKNWRGMTQSGGRRIKRSVHIDIDSIKFCDDEMLSKFEKYRLITEYIRNKREEFEKFNKENNIDDDVIVNMKRLTNAGIFRVYIMNYLKNHSKINQNLTSLVRQLAPGPTGLPIEMYVFTNDTEWGNYENIQADIFDHILAVIPEFDLCFYQNPSGHDISKLTLHKGQF